VSGPDLLKKIASSGAKGTIVNAWASWCGPCRREFPMLIALQDNLNPKGIDIVFVSVDEADGEAIALEFAQERGLSPPILVAERPLGPFKQALHPKWPGMLPATFLFDGEGNLRYFWGGPVYEKELLPILEGFLAGDPIDGQANFGLSRGKDFRNE
jgi:thiol-disulfide isomerase/thioredoxin